MQSDIEAKIQKLLNLSNSPNENEAAAALNMAMKLLAQHGLTMEQVQGKSKTVCVKEAFGEEFKREGLWEAAARGIIRKAFGVRTIRTTVDVVKMGRKVPVYQFYIVGEEKSVEIAKRAYNYLESVFARLWFKERANNNTPLQYRGAFFAGISNGFCQKIDEEKKSLEVNETNALVVINDVAAKGMKHYFPNSVNLTRTYRSNDGVFSRGQEGGRNINLNPSVTSKPRMLK